MITTSHFTVGHIGRTGGDAVKYLIHAALAVDPLDPYVVGSSLLDAAKHRAFDGSEKTRVLSIRRLPSYVLGMREHHIVYARVKPWTADFCAELTNGDGELKRMTANGAYPVDRWLRCEYLRDDICALLSDVYGAAFNSKLKAILYGAMTKEQLPYDHNVFNFFNAKQLSRLYDVNPCWAALEQKLYGSVWR